MAAIPRKPPPGTGGHGVDPSTITNAPSLDQVAQSHGYPNFAAWQAAEPELAQQAYNQQPTDNPSGPATQAPGEGGFWSVPWGQLGLNFTSVIGMAFLDPVAGAAIVHADGTVEMLAPGTYSTAGNALTTTSGETATIGDNAQIIGLLPSSVATAAGLGGNLASLRGNQYRQPPPKYAQNDQPLRQQPDYNEHPDEPIPTFRAANPISPGNPTGLPLSQLTLGQPPPALDPSRQIAQDQRYGPPSLDMPPAQPPPPKTGTSLTDKVLSLLGLPLDYLANRQSQNATATATQQLVNAGTQAKADLAKVYGGVTPVLSQVVQRQQANLAPYTSLGSGAASLLGYGLGIPGVQAAPSGVYAPPLDPFGTNNQIIAGGTPPPAGSVLKSSFQQGESPYQPAGPGQTGGTPFPVPTTPAATPSLPSAQTTPGAALSQTQALPLSTLTPQTQTASSYVTMQSPDGEVANVRRDKVAFYQARGAQVVA